MQLIKILSHRLKSLVLDDELDISVNVIAFHGCKNNVLEVKDYDGAHCCRQPSIACVSSRSGWNLTALSVCFTSWCLCFRDSCKETHRKVIIKAFNLK